MSIVEPTLFSLARAAAVSLATLAMLLAAGPGVRSTPRATRTLCFWATMATLLTPGFVIGVVSFNSPMRRDAFGSEQLYFVLVWLRYSPLALLAVWLMPPALSGKAMHCLRQGTSLRWWRRGMWELRAWGSGLWVGTGLVFFLTFQEFELATTWNMRAWPVALFDAQAGGLSLGESLGLAVLPFIIQTVLLAVLAYTFRPEVHDTEEGEYETVRSVFALASPMIGFLGLCLVPAVCIIGGTLAVIHAAGAATVAFAPWRPIWNGFSIAVAAAVFAWLLAGRIMQRHGWRRLLALPGLLGPLLCSLLLLGLLQFPPLHLLRGTLFPTILGLALVLLPIALLLRGGSKTTCDHSSLHVARASGGRRALWLLDGRPRLHSILLLFCFAYGDFTVNSLLAPPQFTSASVRLLNLLHYGRSDNLMLMFVLAFGVPLFAALLTALAASLYSRRRAS